MPTIQWFPGHMAKARREIEEKLKLIDIVIELRDARIPFSSANPMIEDIIGNKPRLILLCKASMADPIITKKWIDYYKLNKILALDIDSLTNYHLKEVAIYAKLALETEFIRRKKRGIINKEIKGMILGIPNVGKSTLINALGNKKSLKVADRPGVTKSQTWMKVGDDLMLLDTPGILWPKFDDQKVGLKLAICGSIKDEILNIDEIAYGAIDIIKKMYPLSLEKKYNVKDDITDNSLILEAVGRSRGALLKGGIVDMSRATAMFINDVRNTRIGVMSYEWPEL